MQMCFILLLLFIFNSFTKEMPGGIDALALSVFCENLVAICTHDRRLWIWIYPWISTDMSMDIDGKSVDMDIDMDGKFHIHCKPANS